MKNYKQYKELKGLMTEIEASLECPVCLMIPREVPIPSCSAGHIICRPCRQNLTNCPTCRVSYNNNAITNTNSLASSMIETILHKCKYSHYQCHVKLKLNDIVKHEEKCPQRSTSCPNCKQTVQLRKFEEHAIEKKCSQEVKTKNRTFSYEMSRNYLKWDGISFIENKEFNPSEDQLFLFAQLQFFDKMFYSFISYQANKRNFIACIFLADDPEVAAKYKARISIFNKDSSRKITYDGDVLPIEEVPSHKEDLSILCRKCWCIQYDSFRQYLWIQNVGENNNKVWKVSLHMDVNVFEKKS